MIPKVSVFYYSALTLVILIYIFIISHYLYIYIRYNKNPIFNEKQFALIISIGGLFLFIWYSDFQQKNIWRDKFLEVRSKYFDRIISVGQVHEIQPEEVYSKDTLHIK